MAAAPEISVDVALAVVISEPDGIFTLKKENKTALEAFLGGRHVFIAASHRMMMRG